MTKATPATVEAKKKTYRDLVLRSRKLPIEEQWKMGPAIKRAKAEATIEIELLALSLR